MAEHTRCRSLDEIMASLKPGLMVSIAANISKILDERKLSAREAERLTGVPHAEFSRIRHAQFQQFTADRMFEILDRLEASITRKGQ